VLRELSEDDAVSVQAWATDPEVYRYMEWGPNTLEETQEFLRRLIPTRLELPRRTFELGFVLKGTDQLVGAGGLRIRSSQHRIADIGYVLRRDAWGQGLGTEAARALVELGLRRLGMHRIWATCHVENGRSARVLEKVGMQREGRLRGNVLKDAAWRDAHLYALVEGDPGIAWVILGG
jgi:RimJ/RimL family protein N-acetyltransferase